MSKIERAYLAGIIDGEGSISSAGRLQVGNTDIDLITWIVKVTGVGYVQLNNENHTKWKICYRWRVGSSAARSILQQIAPYLIIKRKKALAAIENLKDVRSRSNKQAELRLIV